MFAKLTTPGMVSVLSSVTWFYKYTRGRAARGKGVTSLPRPADRSNPFVRDDGGKKERDEFREFFRDQNISPVLPGSCIENGTCPLMLILVTRKSTPAGMIRSTKIGETNHNYCMINFN